MTAILHLDRLVTPQAKAAGTDRPADSQTVFIAGAAARLCRQEPKPVVVPRNGEALSPAAWLGIVAYCYVKGVYAADDIEQEMLRQPTLCQACNHEVPRPEVIRRFRQLNRGTIRLLLEEFFRFLRRKARERATHDLAQLMVSTPVASAASAAPVEETAVFVRREADDCLEKATFIDGMSQL